MKKLFAMLLALAMLLTLCACGGKKDEKADEGKKSEKTEATEKK